MSLRIGRRGLSSVAWRGGCIDKRLGLLPSFHGTASRGFARGASRPVGRYSPPKASGTLKATPGSNSSLGRLAPPRLDGLGTERQSDVSQDAHQDADPSFEDVSPDEIAAARAMVPVANKLHKHAALADGFDEPLPLEALGDESDRALEPLSAAWGGENRQLRPPLEHRPRAPLGLLQRLAEVENFEASSQQSSRKRGQFQFSDEEPIRVRVLDVDALSLEELHRAFMHSLVRRRPAEVCVRVASRVASFRDRYGHHSYENMIRDCSQLFGPVHGPELTALFARCHSTISVPFMLDYTRRYGQFSRKFLAEQVEKSLRPAFFDFLRYQNKGGVRPLPLIVSKPWSLGAYTRLMSKSYLKSRLHEQLKLHGHVPKSELEQDTDADMPIEARVSERLSAAGSLRVEAPSRPSTSERRHSADSDVPRPAIMDAILQAEYSGVGWDSSAATPSPYSGLTEEPARAIRRGVNLALAEAELGSPEDVDDEEEEREGFAGVYDDDTDELVSDEEDSLDTSGGSRFGLQFEHVVPESTYSVSADDGILLDPSTVRKPGAEGPIDELELVLNERWWHRLRRTFFRHDHRAYRLIEGQWQRVPDPRGAHYKPRRKHRPRQLKKEEKLRREMRARSNS
eukprot:TRINITY_DN27254_c0_g1_i1.p1 TRINITY_DN27254_c0_g1~~TRINITY_DN27254_c0_g1_i1.p1  ORF type:complete len:627 (+),score=109.26 TRINITY_DN27254_c0_g1_i1:42-1922(+)